MKTLKIKLLVVIAISLLAAACNDAPQQTSTPADIQASQEINDKLLNSMRQISEKQQGQVEAAGKDALETLTEADRQALIDLTIDESAKTVSQDAEKMVELLQEINKIAD